MIRKVNGMKLGENPNDDDRLSLSDELENKLHTKSYRQLNLISTRIFANTLFSHS